MLISVSHTPLPTFDRIKAAAKLLASGKNQADIARELGFSSRQAVGHWFRGRSEPDMQQLAQLAKALGCHWLELVNDDALVVNDPDERRRLERLRNATPERRALIDAILADGDKGPK